MLLWLAACGSSTPVVYTEDDLLEDMAGYTAWQQPAAWNGLVPSCDEAHGTYVRVYLNDIAAEDFAKDGHFREGALVVEAAFQDLSGTPKMLVAARKVTGYAPAHGDWFQAMLGEEGEQVQLAGRLDVCLSCHNDTDGWVRTRGTTPPLSLADCPEDTTVFDSGIAF